MQFSQENERLNFRYAVFDFELSVSASEKILQMISNKMSHQHGIIPSDATFLLRLINSFENLKDRSDKSNHLKTIQKYMLYEEITKN